MTEGRKDDQEKARMDLLPPDALYEVAEVLTFGAKKYAARNWEKGIAYGRVIGAALRHIFAIMRGEDRDPETGLLHAAHAICCLMFLCSFQMRGMKHLDDRADLTPKEPVIPPNPLDDLNDILKHWGDDEDELEMLSATLRGVQEINAANVAHIHKLEAELRVARAAVSGVHFK